MAYSTTNLYPEDLSGTKPSNLITNEIHNLQSPGPKDFYFIIPFAAPFFVDSIVITNVATGQPYKEFDDYMIGHRFIEAMDSIGRPIAGSIRFMRRDIVGQVKLRYQTIGGQWGFNDRAILAELARKNLNPLERSWGDIDVLPYSFPPYEHDQSLDTLVGSEQLRAALKHIADVMEATASGTTESHLNDFDNPHRVNKIQIGLSNVPNFAMATDQQAVQAVRSDLFTNPRAVLLSIQEYALKPLNAHIDARGNVHGLTPVDIGLGNVPNYPAATPAQAIDPTNNSTLLTPYTASLLVQKINNDPRLDALIIAFDNHITARNPHGITPGMIGTLTTQEIEQKIAASGGGSGGDADSFGGETPAQWEDKFPVNGDINQMLGETAVIYQTSTTAMSGIDTTDPLGPEEIAKRNAKKINWSFGGYAAYGIYNALGDLKIVASTKAKGFPTDVIIGGQNRWASNKDANYYIEANGGIRTWGSDVITVPPEYAHTAVIDPAKKATGIWASKDYAWFTTAEGRLIRGNRSSVGTVELAGDTIIECLVGNGLVDPRPIGLATTGTQEAPVIKPFGDPSWVTAINGVFAGWGEQRHHNSRIGSEYVNFVTKTGADDEPVYYLRLYKINYGTSITLTEVTNQIDIRNHTTGTVVKANTIRGANQVAGSYTHFVFTLPREDSDLCDLLSYGDNSQGQLEMLPTSAPFLAIAAGYQYTITINRMHFVEFWGNSPDNSLLYSGGAYIGDDDSV